MTLDPVAGHFNEVADAYDDVIPFFSTFATRFDECMLWPDLPATVLDLGAGRGAMTARALTRGFRVVAVDAAPRMVELLQRDHPGVEAHVMSADSLDFADESFDLVMASFMIHIVPKPEVTMDEALRVLRPGGRIVLTVPGRADGSPDPWDDEVNELVKSYRRFQPDGDGRHGNDADEEELLKTRGVHGLTSDSVDIALPVPDGDTYWRWMTSHGAGTFARRLPDDKRHQLYRDICDLIASNGGWTVRRSAAVWQGTKS